MQAFLKIIIDYCFAYLNTIKLKRYIVVILLTLFTVLSSFILGPLSKNLKQEHLSSVTTPNVKESSVLSEKYSPLETEKVSDKLDSLLQQINKKHDFHGSLLVAKKGKVLYDNYVGYADFNKKKPLNSKIDTIKGVQASKVTTSGTYKILSPELLFDKK
mgnify:CR=1 FL=1